MSLTVNQKIDIYEFLKLASGIPVVDVRSPSEFNRGHIPGAVNFPLFNDVEREAVGIIYKNQGRYNAIIRGLELAGPSLYLKLREASEISKEGKLLVHCWRGGMRSEAMAWLYSMGDIKTEILEGGYKSYRNHVLAALAEPRKFLILGGLTGSSKTNILKYIKSCGHNVIDLEGLANHKGSAFGGLGQLPQPSTEHFANMLFDELRFIEQDSPVWIEDESRNIGSVFLPGQFYSGMQKAPAVVLIINADKRLPGLVEEYSGFPPDQLIRSILMISKRLGGENTRDAVIAVSEGDLPKAVEIVLKYYDKAYRFGISRKENEKIQIIESDTADVETNALRVLEAAGRIKW